MKLLSKKAVKEKISLSYATIDRKEAEGRFPRRVKVSEFRVAWYEHEIDEWISQLPRS